MVSCDPPCPLHWARWALAHWHWHTGEPQQLSRVSLGRRTSGHSQTQPQQRLPGTKPSRVRQVSRDAQWRLKFNLQKRLSLFDFW